MHGRGTSRSKRVVPVFVILSVLAFTSCAVPTPGVIYWEVCIAYGPNPRVRTVAPDGRVVDEYDMDTEATIKTVMRACRD